MPVPIGVGIGIAIRGAGKALLKNAVKKAKKTPNKEFKHVNIKTKKKINDRTGKMKEYPDKTPVKGKQGKKNYIQKMKKYDRSQENMQIGNYAKLRGLKK